MVGRLLDIRKRKGRKVVSGLLSLLGNVFRYRNIWPII